MDSVQNNGHVCLLHNDLAPAVSVRAGTSCCKVLHIERNAYLPTQDTFLCHGPFIYRKQRGGGGQIIRVIGNIFLKCYKRVL
jgi:hypothetical protein